MTYNVKQPIGEIEVLKFGEAGLSGNADQQNKYWIGLDRNSHVVPENDPGRRVGIQYYGRINGGGGVGSFTMIQTIKYQGVRDYTDPADMHHVEKSGYYLDSNGDFVMVDGKRKTLNDYPALDSLSGRIGYGFRLNTEQMGKGAPPIDYYSAPVLATGGDPVNLPNKLYANDSPGSSLWPAPNWKTGTESRTDYFTITLMYNPDPNAPVGPDSAMFGTSIWILVGSLNWDWTATASYDAALAGVKWAQSDADQNQGNYAITTKFPTWDAWRDDSAQKSNFETFKA